MQKAQLGQSLSKEELRAEIVNNMTCEASESSNHVSAFLLVIERLACAEFFLRMHIYNCTVAPMVDIE